MSSETTAGDASRLKLIIVSGLSGSGKSIALHTLEDAGFFCVDNLPTGMLSLFVSSMQNSRPAHDRVAVSIDARCDIDDLGHFENIYQELETLELDIEVIFLTTRLEELLTRFSETRRKHPLSRKGLTLNEAIAEERVILQSISSKADLTIDTSDLNVHELKHIIKARVSQDNRAGMVILIQSFGFKHGLPADTDFMFDVRCLPNPHWKAELRPLTGLDQPVIDYLSQFTDVDTMKNSILDFLRQWIPCFEKEGRSYMTVSIGCTGGQHRSVYLTQQICDALKLQHSNVSLRHRERQ
jgi:UPF0042 nucleotide-binding protein